MANIIEIVSIAAIAIISIIFAIYLVILKKNGWLGGKSDFYRCPNQKCKKIFQKPIELKDLSETPPRIYPACPECGANLNTFFGCRTEKSSKTLLHLKKLEVNSTEKKLEKEIGETTNQFPKQVPKSEKKVPSRQTIISREKENVTDNSECQYYFGYLAEREEVGEIPASCLGCQKSLDCMLCVIKSGESIKEIKKWY